MQEFLLLTVIITITVIRLLDDCVQSKLINACSDPYRATQYLETRSLLHADVFLAHNTWTTYFQQSAEQSVYSHSLSFEESGAGGQAGK